MASSPDTKLVAREELALAADERIDSLDLDPLARGVPNLPIAERILAATSTLTIEGASTLSIDVHDPEQLLEQSGALVNDHGRLARIDMQFDGLWYRLVQFRRSGETVTLTFEDLLVALLRTRTKPRTWSRGTVTRAQAIEAMVDEVDPIHKPFYAPEKGRRQPVAQADIPSPAPGRGDTGFDKGTRLELKDWTGNPHTLDGDQMRNAATALSVAAEVEATDRPTVALLEAGIVEAPFFSNPQGGDSSSVGMLQLLASHLNGSTSTKGGRRDVALVCRLFLTTGFTGKGGAIKLARENPGWSPGQIAQAVQGSAFPTRYDAVHDSAIKVFEAWKKGDQHTAGSDSVLTVKSYQFSRGLAGKRESSWAAAQRLAQEVNWRFFIAAGIAVFISDDRLMLTPASFVLDQDDAALLELPSYDFDEGKILSQAELHVSANRWSVRAGDVAILRGARFGPIEGQWIVHTVEQNLLDATDTTVTLVKPLPARKEPAAEIVSVATSGSTSDNAATAKVRAEAGRISRENLPYVWGGGHAKAGTPDHGDGSGGVGFDCSGYTAACLRAGGLLPDAWQTGVPGSGEFASSWGDPGEGQHMTVWANTDHVWIEFHDQAGDYARADTSPHQDGPDGPHLRHKQRSTSGFTARHHPGT